MPWNRETIVSLEPNTEHLLINRWHDATMLKKKVSKPGYMIYNYILKEKGRQDREVTKTRDLLAYKSNDSA